jgi:hypothetical protein
MNCPNEVSNSVLEILRIGILRIRVFGFEGNASRCASEADHLHNLPGLLISYQPGALKYYLEVEQPIFVEKSQGTSIADFEKHWEQLKTYVAKGPC